MTCFSMAFDPFRASDRTLGVSALPPHSTSLRLELRFAAFCGASSYGREYWSMTREIARWQTRQNPTGLRVNMMQSISER